MSADLRRGLLLALLSLAVYQANLREVSSQDTIPTRLLPIAVIRDGRLDLDAFFRDRPPDAPMPYWVQRVDGHYRSSYPVLPALLAVPVYAGPVLLFRGDSWALVNALAKLAASLFVALSVLFLFLALRRLDPGADATLITMTYALGTSSWSTASQGLWGHGPAQLALAVALYAALRGEDDRRFWHGAGLAAGLMIAARPTTVLVALALAGYVLQRGRRHGLACLLLLAGTTLVFALHNLWTFGSMQGGYAWINASHPALHGAAGTWSTPALHGLAGLLVSPSRGLLVYSPVLAFGLAGTARAFLGRGPLLWRWLALGLLTSLGMLSRYSVWWGGHAFGPRLLSDFVPILALGLAPFWRRDGTPRPLRLVLLALLAVSMGVQAVGAFYHPGPRAVDWNWSPVDVDFAHARLWEWRDPQLLRLLAHGPHPPGFTDRE